jgi:lipopolysaccharide/colanic/teichoic acid biosynthesis glycosyltransferase
MAHSIRTRPVPLIKRLTDLAVGAAMAAVLLPVLVAAAAAVRVRLGNPILFRQPRPGRGGRIFQSLKFRTMTDDRDATGDLLPDAQRITRLGRFLRSTSIDELPNLWNVLRGEMSLVGPRPLLVRYLDRYTPEQARRHEVLPGITGWAQVNGRNAISWEQKFALDVWYVDHWSYGLDWKILFLTLWRAVRREGIAPPGAEFADEFMGTQDALRGGLA